MRIFVTGATGFLGSYVVTDLIDQGHDVAVLLRPGVRPWRLAAKLDRLTVIGGALDDLAALGSGLRSFRPDAVVHMAWRGVGNSDRNNKDQARNVVDTVDLVDLAADAGATIFVGAGSQAEYGPYDRAIVESDPPKPTTLYGIAKLASCLMAERRCAERKLRFVWLRIFSVYGPKDNDSWLIPSLIRTLRSNGHMALTGCEQRWGFLHARDAAAAVRLVLASPAAEGVYNLGSPEAPPLRETVTRLRDQIGAGDLGFGEVPYRPDQVMVLAADVRRLEGLGWRPAVGLDQGLRETVAWSRTAEAGDR
ncbi:NAD(P)-dependent oxidoreductase [Bradyrhizobium xenonodulans]|uniref:NAD(P)-dependent oxidoreductase n=1 Tax=Bradyrhizobium xenonodulans TaxID=2736875 RepID=A0ABY7MDL1_9BRAD|nr:NAD(P)-dependent oxidoreductase [Bradyrhizobium xenonodulans]WBL76461.1 NAD(P)-dependent oxidoreductase [Bradyrhizobium xenonodulans]